MKINGILLPVVAVMLAGCHQPDELVREDTSNVMDLAIKGTLLQNQEEYDAVVDNEDYTVTLNVPYYISDMEEIMSDLSEVKFRASSLPLGAKFEPGLSGIHDMSDDQYFVSTLVYEDGTRAPYTFRTVRKKSSDARLASATLTDEDVRAVISITDPTEENPKGKLTVLKTSGSVEAALQSVKLIAADWATIQAPGYDAETGILDLTSVAEVFVFSQDGATKTVYEVSIETPSTVAPGQVGYISNLFGLQCTNADPLGFEADANYTIAAVDNYLIVSNKNDFTKMLIFNRFSGRRITDVIVNTSGIEAGRELRAISTDDDGNLVAFAYTNTIKISESTIANGYDLSETDENMKVYVWKNGITAAPECILDRSIYCDEIVALKTTNKAAALQGTELGNSIAVKGSLSSGRAVITSTEKLSGRIVGFFFQNGKYQTAEIFCPKKDGKAQWFSTGNSSKAIPFNTESPLYFALASGNYSQQLAWYTESTYFVFNAPSKYWWTGSTTYGKDVRGYDIVEFNGTQLLAVQNGQSSGSIWTHRLYVANIGLSPAQTSLATGYLFDSREGAGIAGTGYGVTGMTSTYPFVGGTPLGGDNVSKRGDVIFVKSADGNVVQVYMMTTNAGILAYEITRYDM